MWKMGALAPVLAIAPRISSGLEGLPPRPTISGSLSLPSWDLVRSPESDSGLVPPMPRWARPVASICAITSHRDLLALAHPSLWNHPLSMVLL